MNKYMPNTSFLGIMLLCVLLMSCCKSTVQTNEFALKEINGVVYNSCTDSGLAGVQVRLETIFDEKEVLDMQTTVSGENGKFSFPDAKIYEGNRVTYAIH